MNSEFLLKPIPIARILAIANCHYQDVIPFIDVNSNNAVRLSVPAGNAETPFPLQSIGSWDFIVTHIVATYTTLITPAGILDDGVGRILFNLNFGGWNRNLSRQFFPAEQFFTPGRIRAPEATNNTGANQCPPSNPLVIPRPMPILLLKTQQISLILRNSSDQANFVTMSLHGWRVTLDETKLKEILDSVEAKNAVAVPLTTAPPQQRTIRRLR